MSRFGLTPSPPPTAANRPAPRRYVAAPPETAGALRTLGAFSTARMKEWFNDARPIGAGEATRLLLIHHGHGKPGPDGLTQTRLAALRAVVPTWDALLRGLPT